MVEKLQELRSIRVQKLKKQGKISLFTYYFYLPHSISQYMSNNFVLIISCVICIVSRK
jgi:hypothetical protein